MRILNRDLKLQTISTKENVKRIEFAMYKKPEKDDSDVYVRLYKGQSLFTLAKTYYDDASLWWFIALANNLLLPFNINENFIIRIPPKSKII